MTEIAQFENEIIQEAKQQANNILHEAEQEAAKILDHARNEAEQILQTVLHEKEQEEERKGQRELSRLRIISKIELNNVKERLIEQVFTTSLKRIQEWKDKKSEEYRSALANQIIQGGVSLEGGDLTIKLASEDASLVDIPRLESEITKICDTKTSIKVIASEADAVESGSIICKGSLAVHNTIKAKFDRREAIIRNKLHNILFSN